MFKTRKLLWALACGALLAGGALAQPAPSAIEGEFRYAGGVREHRAVQEAIAAATAELPRPERIRLAAKLEEIARPPARLTLGRDGATLSVRYAGARQQLTSPDDQSAVQVREGLTLRQRMDGGALEQELTASDLTQRYRFALGRDGRTLTVRAELIADGIAPIVYTLTYVRQ